MQDLLHLPPHQLLRREPWPRDVRPAPVLPLCCGRLAKPHLLHDPALLHETLAYSRLGHLHRDQIHCGQIDEVTICVYQAKLLTHKGHFYRRRRHRSISELFSGVEDTAL